LDRVAGSSGADRAVCADGEDNCIRPAGTSAIAALAGGDYSVCRGSVDPMLTINDYVGNNSRVPDNYNCTTNQDCAASGPFESVTGMQCIGPENPWRGKYCYLDSANQARFVHEDDPDHPGGAYIRARSGFGGAFNIQPGITPCVHNGIAGSTVTPLVCNGSSNTQYTCVYCPSSGDRVWTYLMSGSPAAAEQIGVCNEKSAIGNPCSGS